jgi:hypothetical protein
LLQQLPDLLCLQRVKAGGRFIEDQDVRVMQHRLRKAEALRHAGRQTARQAGGDGAQLHLLQCVVDCGPQGLALEAAQSARPGQIFGHRQLGVGGHTLWQKADMAAQQGRRQAQRLTEDKYLTTGGRKHAGEDLHQRRFARTVDPEQAESFAWLQLKVDVFKPQPPFRSEAYVLSAQQGLHAAAGYRARRRLRSLSA